MDELMQQWQELVDNGSCTEDFESWYSGLIDYAHDSLEDR